ncbi:MAG: ATP-binding protein [Anaerolineales bacterium]
MVSLLSNPGNPSEDVELNTSEISHLLDITSDPAVLVSLPKLKIIASNRHMAELSGYTREELLNLHLETLLPQIVQVKENESSTLELHSIQGHEIDFITRRKQKINTNVQAHKIGKGKQFSLYKVRPASRERRKKLDAESEKKRLEAILELSHALQGKRIEDALSEIVLVGKELLTAESLAIYTVSSNHPQLKVIAKDGQEAPLPETISTADYFSHYQTYIFSPPFKPPLSPLQELGKENQSSFLAVAPLSDTQSVTGLIVALGPRDTAPPGEEKTITLMKLLATVTQGVLNTFFLTTNLQDRLSDHEAQLAIGSTIQNNIPEGVIYLKPDLTIQEVNPAAEQILGYAEEEILGRHIDDVIIGADRLPSALQDALDGIPTHDLGQLEIHHRDGSVFPSQIKTFPVLAPQTRDIQGILIFLQDISKEEKVRIRTQQLERRALVGQMNAIFAHEIRNPINNITSGIQLLEKTLPEEYPNRKVIEGLNDDCDRLTHIVDTVLTFSKSQSYHRTPIDLPALINQILNRWYPRMKRTRVKHVTKVEDDLPKVLGDYRALGQVFNNLISNAVRAMEETDGGVLSIRMKPYRKLDGKPGVQVDVLDTGPGIPKEIQKHIFEPFFTTKPDGTGLGLSITKQIITMHEGTIKLIPLPEGTSFRIVLPGVNAEEQSE